MVVHILQGSVSEIPGCVAQCKACRHKHLTYSESCRQKQDFVNLTLGKYCHVQPLRTPPDIMLAGYRRKVLLAASYNHQWHIGTTHRNQVTAIHDCPVHHPSVNRTVRLLAECLPSYREFPMVYFVQNESQVVLVLKTVDFPGTGWLSVSVKTLLRENGIEGLHIHLHPSAGKKVFGKGGLHCLFGSDMSKDEQGYSYGPMSFQQLIPELRDAAHTEIISFFSPETGDLFMDMFCGTGIMLNKMLKTGITSALGIEISGEGVKIAGLHAPEAVILRGTCQQRMPQADEWLHNMSNVNSGKTHVFVNPPRTGLGSSFADWLSNTIRPCKIAYLSCSPGTLAKDLEVIQNSGYIIRTIIPFDFFPWTQHVETLVLMEKDNF